MKAPLSPAPSFGEQEAWQVEASVTAQTREERQAAYQAVHVAALAEYVKDLGEAAARAARAERDRKLAELDGKP